MDCSTPGFPVLHHLLEFAQTHVHWVDDAIQSSHPLSPASPPVLNLSQHWGLFQWIGSLHQVDKVLERQHQSFQSEYSDLISFSIDWFDLLAVQGTLKSQLLLFNWHIYLASARGHSRGWWNNFFSITPTPTPYTWHRAGICCKLTDKWKDSASRESSWHLSTLSSLSTKMGTWLSPHGRGHLLREVTVWGPCDVCSELTGWHGGRCFFSSIPTPAL